MRVGLLSSLAVLAALGVLQPVRAHGHPGREFELGRELSHELDRGPEHDSELAKRILLSASMHDSAGVVHADAAAVPLNERHLAARRLSRSASDAANATTWAQSGRDSLAPENLITSTTSSACSGRVNPKNGNYVIAGYWPDWVGDQLAISKIPFDKYDLIYYAFGTPTKSGQVNLDSGSDTLLKQLVSAASKQNTKVVLSVGGWSDSKYFSSLVATESSRQTFANTLRWYVDTYKLGGIDVDWEYPNGDGAGSNEKSSADTKNYQTFLQLLRSKLPNAVLSAATTTVPWTASSGNPVPNVSRAAGALDFIFVMNYDTWGSSSNPGPNAPLANLCGDSDQPDASAAAAVAAWTAAGMPREKILMGLPMYGYVSKSSATRLQERRRRRRSSSSELDAPDDDDNEEEEGGVEGEATQVVPRSAYVQGAGAHRSHRKPTAEEIQTEESLLHPGQGSSFKQATLSTGQQDFSVLVAQGYLTKDDSGNFKADSGWTLVRDSCSDTPYMFNHQQVITYDDPLSIYEKSVFSALAGIGGVGFWSIEGDTEDHDLVRAAIRGLNLQAFAT